MFGRNTSLEAAPLLEIPQLASLMVFFVALLFPPEELSCRAIALPLMFTIVLLCAMTPVEELNEIPPCDALMVFDVALAFGPACWNIIPLLD